MQITGGIASTTHVDFHGQRMTKSALDQFAHQIKATYVPLLIDHDFNRQIGVNFTARVVALEDGEYALLVVNGIFDDADEATSCTAGEPNTVWAEYEPALDEVERIVPELLTMADDDTVSEALPPAQIVAEQLALHLDSTEVMPDGTVYLVKRRIAVVGSLEIHIYPKDHEPPHFHVVSKQRKIDARFHIDTLEYLNMKRGEIRAKEIRQIQDFFATRPDALQTLRDEYAHLQG